MKKSFYIFLLLFLSFAHAFGQANSYTRADSIFMTNKTKSAVFIIQNATKDSTGAFAKNIGKGVLRFVKIQISDVKGLSDSLSKRIFFSQNFKYVDSVLDLADTISIKNIKLKNLTSRSIGDSILVVHNNFVYKVAPNYLPLTLQNNTTLTEGGFGLTFNQTGPISALTLGATETTDGRATVDYLSSKGATTDIEVGVNPGGTIYKWGIRNKITGSLDLPFWIDTRDNGIRLPMLADTAAAAKVVAINASGKLLMVPFNDTALGGPFLPLNPTTDKTVATASNTTLKFIGDNTHANWLIQGQTLGSGSHDAVIKLQVTSDSSPNASLLNMNSTTLALSFVNSSGKAFTADYTSGKITDDIGHKGFTVSHVENALATDSTLMMKRYPDSLGTTYAKLASANTFTANNAFNNDLLVNSIIIGHGAGNISTNTIVGNGSGVANTTGLGNTFIGQGISTTGTTASSNTGVGRFTLEFLTTGNQNTGLGIISLRNVTTGSGNNAVGSQSGKNVTTGINNNFYGVSSGVTTTTGSYNLFLGAASGWASVGAGDSQKFRIENVYGAGSTPDSTQTLLTGDFHTQQLGIPTQPTASAGTYRILTWNSSTGAIESIASGGGGGTPDSTIFRTVANSYSLSSMQTKLNNYALTSALPAGANPSATIGLTAVNGSATTFLRSDAAQALSQSITPSWTALHAWTESTTSTTVAPLIALINTSTSSGSSNLYGPAIDLQTRLFNASTDKAIDFYIKPHANSSTGVGELLFTAKLAGGSETTLLSIDRFGNFNATGSFIAKSSYILQGSSSGSVSINTQATSGTYNFNVPITAGSAGDVLTSQGGGSTAMIWVTPTWVTNANFVYSEVPTGSINSSNVTYTLANTPVTGKIAAYRNGVRTTAFTISTNTVTMTTAPLTGDTLIFDYIK